MKIAALDIGGTSIKSGLWDGAEISEIRETDTNAALGGARLMENAVKILKSYSGFDAIGISTAGQVDVENGTICYANDNIPGYTGTKIKEIFEKEFGVPVFVDNDVNAAAYGEMAHGAAKGLSDFLCLTYGTGIGGAFVTGGKIYYGSTYCGASFGGIVVHPEDIVPGVDFSGCYEKYASATALVKSAMKVDPELTNGRKIFEASARPEIKAVIDGWIDEIVYGLITLIHIFNPTDIVFGGGVLSQSYVANRIKMQVFKYVYPQTRNVRLHQAKLANSAGMIGAAFMAQKLIEK